MIKRYVGSVSKNEAQNCLSGKIDIEGAGYWIDIYPRETDGKKWWSVQMKERPPLPVAHNVEDF